MLPNSCPSLGSQHCGVLSCPRVQAFLWPFTCLVRNIVAEKEAKLKEGMKMMVGPRFGLGCNVASMLIRVRVASVQGLTDAVFWSTWFVTYAIQGPCPSDSFNP